MKWLSVLFCLLLLTGCMAPPSQPPAETTERRPDAPVVQTNTVETVVNPPAVVEPLTKEAAEAIALAHAGFTAEQVTGLHTNYEIDDTIPQFDVEFHVGRVEYDYEIHAETGEILSFSMDD